MKIILTAAAMLTVGGMYHIGLDEFARIDSLGDAATVIPMSFLVGLGDVIAIITN